MPRTTITPTSLAQDLKVDPKQVRAFLRKKFPRKSDARNTSWVLTPAQIKATRENFRKATPKATPKRAPKAKATPKATPPATPAS